MMHMLAYDGVVIASAANQNVSAVVDNVITTSANNKYISPARVQVYAASAMNDFITRSRINAPSLRNEGLPEIFPVTVSNLPAAIPLVTYWDRMGPTIQQNEEVGLEISDGVSVTLRAHGFLCIRDLVSPVPAGKRMRIVGTSALTLTVGTWVSGNLALDQTLPFGQYSVVGMAVICAGAYAARLIFPRSMAWRPGCPVAAGVGGVDAIQQFMAGRLGEWGQFTSVAQPLIEIVGNTAGAQTATVIMDIVQVSTG
jgi:hypothetical protein